MLSKMTDEQKDAIKTQHQADLAQSTYLRNYISVENDKFEWAGNQSYQLNFKNIKALSKPPAAIKEMMHLFCTLLKGFE